MAKDLRQFKLEEFQLNGVFYRKEPDGSWSNCMVTSEEIKDQDTRKMLLDFVTDGVAKGILFIRINKPWGGFE